MTVPSIPESTHNGIVAAIWPIRNIMCHENRPPPPDTGRCASEWHGGPEKWTEFRDTVTDSFRVVPPKETGLSKGRYRSANSVHKFPPPMLTGTCGLRTSSYRFATSVPKSPPPLRGAASDRFAASRSAGPASPAARPIQSKRYMSKKIPFSRYGISRIRMSRGKEIRAKILDQTDHFRERSPSKSARLFLVRFFRDTLPFLKIAYNMSPSPMNRDPVFTSSSVHSRRRFPLSRSTSSE